MRISLSVSLILALFTLFSPNGINAAENPEYNRKYDENRDPSADLALVAEIASKDGRYILTIVGGEWCTWCKSLEAHFETETEMYASLTAVFEVMKINYSKQNKNEAFLSQYPEVKAYPHFFIFNAQQELISSIDSLPFKKDKAYINQPFELLIKNFADKMESNRKLKN